jgi:hypothetical protein
VNVADRSAQRYRRREVGDRQFATSPADAPQIDQTLLDRLRPRADRRGFDVRVRGIAAA